MPGRALQQAMLVGVALLAACAAAPTVSTVPADDIRRDPGRLPDVGYLVTGQPDAAALEAAAASGYVGVVDLRTPTENRGFDEAGTARDLGLRYVSLPIVGAADVTYDNAAALSEILEQFDGPVLLHCSSGNRVGALFALRASAAGADTDESLAAGRAAGLTSLEPAVRQRLERRR